MPELPDIVVYMEALEDRVVGHVLENVEVRGPSLLRTADPPIYSIQGHTVAGLRRIGARAPTASWGSIFFDGSDAFQATWWIALFPGLAIIVTVLAFNVFGNALRDALDPHQLAGDRAP